MVLLMIVKGVDGQPPSPGHAQLLGDDTMVYIGQTATGWINNELKTSFLNLQLERGILGTRPMVVNVDGHDSNLNNPELVEIALQNKILLVIPPSLMSAAVNGMGTQQCDRLAHQGGPIACLKAAFRRLFKQQWFAKLRCKERKSQVSIAEIAALLAKAWQSRSAPQRWQSSTRTRATTSTKPASCSGTSPACSRQRPPALRHATAPPPLQPPRQPPRHLPRPRSPLQLRRTCRPCPPILAGLRRCAKTRHSRSSRSVATALLSRTGRPALAKNNHDNALREEAREATASRDATLLPPTPPRASAPVDDNYICPFCEAVVDDITPDENAFVFCPHCEARMDDFEEQ
jgi:hypothetical protein